MLNNTFLSTGATEVTHRYEVVIENKGRSFADENIAIMPFIDPDSSRYAEWMWAICNARSNMDVHLLSHTIHDRPDIELIDLMNEIRNHFNGSLFIGTRSCRGLRINNKGNYPELYVTMSYVSSDTIIIHALGNSEEVNDIINKFSNKYKKPNTLDLNILRGFGNNGPLTSLKVLKETDQLLAEDDFYLNIPQLQNGIDYFINEFLNSKSNILLLWGRPGTGKSSFIRNILFKSNLNEYGLVSDSNAIANLGFINWISSFDDKSLIAIEDADLLVKSRESGNQQMSALLNFAEGVVKNNTKLVISTNLTSLKDIDSALIRKGRAFSILEFKPLTPDMANKARISIGKEPIDFGQATELTLSEALNWIDFKDAKEHKNNGLVGFY